MSTEKVVFQSTLFVNLIEAIGEGIEPASKWHTSLR
jgi:hypothetical protein